MFSKSDLIIQQTKLKKLLRIITYIITIVYDNNKAAHRTNVASYQNIF